MKSEARAVELHVENCIAPPLTSQICNEVIDGLVSGSWKLWLSEDARSAKLGMPRMADGDRRSKSAITSAVFLGSNA